MTAGSKTSKSSRPEGRCPSCGLSPYESGIGDSDISRVVAELNWAKEIAADAIAEANRCRKALREIAEADAKTPVLSLNRIAQRALEEDVR